METSVNIYQTTRRYISVDSKLLELNLATTHLTGGNNLYRIVILTLQAYVSQNITGETTKRQDNTAPRALTPSVEINCLHSPFLSYFLALIYVYVYCPLQGAKHGG
jgi:hypothetical protein